MNRAQFFERNLLIAKLHSSPAHADLLQKQDVVVAQAGADPVRDLGVGRIEFVEALRLGLRLPDRPAREWSGSQDNGLFEKVSP
jgi:hypothetical protein